MKVSKIIKDNTLAYFLSESIALENLKNEEYWVILIYSLSEANLTLNQILKLFENEAKKSNFSSLSNS